MVMGNQPFCEDWLVPLTVRHLLVECPSLGDIRHQFLSQTHGRYILAKILGGDVVYDASGTFRL